MGGGGEALQHSNGLSCATGRIVTWRLVPLLFLCSVVNQMDRINIGFAHLQMRPELGFSDAVYGLAASLFFVGYILFEVPSNLLLDRIGGGKRLPKYRLRARFVTSSRDMQRPAGRPRE
jgi:MFS family permease